MSDVGVSPAADTGRGDLKRRRAGAGAASSPALIVYIAVLLLCAAVLAVLGWRLRNRAPDADALIVLCLLGVLGTTLRERNLGPKVGISIASVILAAALVLVGPFGAVVVGFVSYLLDVNRQPWRIRLFNAAMAGVLGGVGGQVYRWAGGLAGVENLDDLSTILLGVGLPLAIAYAVITVLNTVLLGIAVNLTSGTRLPGFVLRTLRSIGLSYMSYGLIGFLFVVLWGPEHLGPFSALLVLAPLFVAQLTFTQYAEERRAHERTVSTLVATVEASNPYTAGHSERVARLCALMAPRLGVRAQETEALGLAAVLHDVGTVATPLHSIRKDGPLQVEDLTAIAEHPQAGVAMLKDISFLADALPGVLYHHERFDGRGYPFGISGTDIPLYARMIAVADAFDSLTTTRSYRPARTVPEALAELRRRAGAQFDPQVVQALTEALERESWSPTVLDDRLLSEAGAYHDHDDPVVSDLFAEWAPADEEVQR